MIRYIAYGSNLVIERISNRIGKIKVVGTSALPGWYLCFNKLGQDGSGKCNLIKYSSATAYGAIYEISDVQKVLLNDFEKGYKTISMAVPGFGKCFTYTAKNSIVEKCVPPFTWYKKLVLIGAKRHQFPLSYIKYLEGIAACPDPDQERANRNLAAVI